MRYSSAALLMLSLLITTEALAADVAVFPPRGTNLAPGEAAAVGTLVGESFALLSGKSVILPADAAATLRETGSDTLAAGRLGTAQYISTTAVRLETKLVLRSSLHTADGDLVHSVRMTAASLDDVEQVSQRIAAGLATGQGTEQTRTLHNITTMEGRVPNRTFSEKVMGVKTSFISFMDSERVYDPAMTIGFDGRLEADSYFIEFGAGFMIPTSSATDYDAVEVGGLISEIGASLYLNDGRMVSPYLGGGVLPRILFDGDDGGVRLAAYGQMGLMFFRQSSTRLYLDVRLAQNLIPFSGHSNDDYDYDYGEQSGDWRNDPSEQSFPTELTVSCGIGW